jgi:hypothetical protein
MVALDSLLDPPLCSDTLSRVNRGFSVAVHITREVLRATYALLLTTLPFRGWRLPAPEDVKFILTKNLKDRGDFRVGNGKAELRVSQMVHETLHSLTMTVAHEMCHMKEWEDMVWREDVAHSDYFCRLADRVCKVHLFDRGQF